MFLENGQGIDDIVPVSVIEGYHKTILYGGFLSFQNANRFIKRDEIVVIPDESKAPVDVIRGDMKP